MPAPLPDFIEPMLARIGAAFDSDRHLFELKWDGIRCLAFLEASGHRLMSRRGRDMAARYPEFVFPQRVAPGTVLDGELVVLREGKPDFTAVLSREHARSEVRIRGLARSSPATFVVFDLLYLEGRSVMGLPLEERRRLLAETLEGVEDPRLVLSEGVVGAGLGFFAEVQRLGFEGMVAKELRSRYLPGRRTDAWTKTKPVQRMHCAIVGWLEERGRLRSLIVAAASPEGELRCVGRVGSGLDAAQIAELERLLPARERPRPIVECGKEGRWVEPGLYCVVSYLERTSSGNLRAPVFLELVGDQP